MINFNQIPRVTKALLIANIACFLLMMFMQTQNIELNRLLGVYFPKSDYFQLYQIITHMFMHAGFGHLFFNMFGLYMFGSLIENYFGEKRYLLLYFVSGIGAYLLQSLSMYIEYPQTAQLIWDGKSAMVSTDMLQIFDNPMVGASGAIFGVLASFAVVYPNMPLYLFFIPIPIKAKYIIGAYFLIELFSGINPSGVGDNVAHFAHVGGAVVGFILTKYWMRNRFRVN